MNDPELLQMLRSDPEQGLSEMIRSFGGYVYTIVRSKLSECGTREDIEETVSDVFVQLYQWVQAHPDEPANVRALLAVIAKRHSINRFYALTKQPLCDSYEALLTDLPDPAAAPDDRVMLMQAVKSLGEPESEIILRRYYFGQSSKEIGRALGLKPNTVDQKLSRSLRKLREALDDPERRNKQ